ncbi:MAG TPA: type VI immunity family protein, partial [Myxococcaceae bacterium]
QGLRERLKSPETTVQELPGDKAVITLGAWPEAGDLEKGEVLPAYRELARVLEPWLYHRETPMLQQSEEETRRWERRFLD